MLKPIPIFDNYSITEYGCIYSNKGIRMRPHLTRWGYYRIKLSRNGKSKLFHVHRLVLEAYVGPCPEGMEACHNNGIRTDNRLENLRWDTRKNNHRDAIKQGTHTCLNQKKKLTEDEARQIYYCGTVLKIRQRSIALEFGVSQRTVWNIIHKKKWKSLWKN